MKAKEIRELIDSGPNGLTSKEYMSLDIQLKVKILESLRRIEKKVCDSS